MSMHASSTTDPATNQNKTKLTQLSSAESPCAETGGGHVAVPEKQTGATDMGRMHFKVQIPIKRKSFHQTK
jgi:hypothetical protein